MYLITQLKLVDFYRTVAELHGIERSARLKVIQEGVSVVILQSDQLGQKSPAESLATFVYLLVAVTLQLC